jgi:rhodanese-related sulfurtransferase
MNIAILQNRTLPAILVLAFAVAISALTQRQAFEVKELSAEEVRAISAVVIDVRDRATSASAHIPGALLIPLETLVAQVHAHGIAKDARLVVYCGDGSLLGPRGAHLLTQAGYTNVVNLKGGIQAWQTAGFAVATS